MNNEVCKKCCIDSLNKMKKKKPEIIKHIKKGSCSHFFTKEHIQEYIDNDVIPYVYCKALQNDINLPKCRELDKDNNTPYTVKQKIKIYEMSNGVPEGCIHKNKHNKEDVFITRCAAKDIVEFIQTLLNVPTFIGKGDYGVNVIVDKDKAVFTINRFDHK